MKTFAAILALAMAYSASAFTPVQPQRRAGRTQLKMAFETYHTPNP